MVDGAFSDVTLVTEDKNIFKAHKNILSACSPFFKNLMTFDSKSSSIIYLKGVDFVELKLIMQFVYLGEATINEERMSEFLEVAKSLEIKELNPKMAEEGNIDEIDLKPVEGHDIESNKEIPNELTSSENQDISLDNLEKDEKNIETWDQGKESLFSCEQCENKYSRSSHLRRHIKAKHEDFKYACEFCDFQTKIQYHHKKHFEESHVGIKYVCEHCNYEATRKGNLKRHIERTHEKQKNPSQS